MKKFVLVSGVDPNTNLDLIDEEIIRITGKPNPKMLFIPVASGDSISYCDRYKNIYEGKFKRSMDILNLFTQSPNEHEIREKVFAADIVYIGGGPTVRLMEYFNKFNMKSILMEAVEKGIVIAGISACSICWGKHYFHAEEPKDFAMTGFKDYIKVDCMGYFDFLLCPHYNLVGYSQRINATINEYKMLGIALDNNCALEIIDDTYRIITCKEGAKAYALHLKDGEIIKEAIEKKYEFSDIKELISVAKISS